MPRPCPIPPTPVRFARRPAPHRAIRPSTRGAVVAALCAVGVAGVAAPRVAFAQEVAAPLARVRGAIRLDGRVDEAAWLEIAPLPLTQFQPVPGGPIRDRGEIRVAYDDVHLYASGRFTDAQPSGIRVNSLRRDSYAEDDALNLVVDTFRDRESAVWFLVTPAGTRIDGAISNDAEGPESQWNHPEYDMPWDAAAERTPDGWSVELRIPLSALRFQVRDGRVTMGLIAARVISRRKERHIFPAIRPTVALAQFKPSLAAPVTLVDVAPPRLWSVTPYVLGGRDVRRAAAPTGQGAAAPTSRRRELVREIGADARIGLSSRATLDLTLNTDFAQTEVDDQRVNLTRFSLFFPERRQFFLERAGLFDVATGAEDRVFYSRRVGLAADGSPVRVMGGARLVGRFGAWDVGAMDLQVAAADGGPDRHAAVVRARRTLGNPFSYAGVIATSDGEAPGTGSRTLGLDGTLRVAPTQFVTWSAATVHDGAGPLVATDRSTWRVAWERRRRAGWGASGALGAVGERYAPALGFVSRAGAAALQTTVRHGWMAPRGAIRDQAVALTTLAARGARSRVVESALVEPSWTAALLDGSNVALSASARREVLTDTFRLSPAATVAPGAYTFVEGTLAAGSAPGGVARVRVELQGGSFFDGRRASVLVQPAWNPSRHVELSADAEANRVWFPGRRQRFLGDVARLRLRLARDAHLSLSGSVQFNRAERVLTSSVRLRHMLREGTELFVVLNDQRDDAGAAPGWLGLPRTTAARYAAVKYRHTFR